MQVSRDDDPLLELCLVQVAQVADNGVGNQWPDVAEVRSVGEEAGFPGKLCTDAEAKRP